MFFGKGFAKSQWYLVLFTCSDVWKLGTATKVLALILSYDTKTKCFGFDLIYIQRTCLLCDIYGVFYSSVYLTFR